MSSAPVHGILGTCAVKHDDEDDEIDDDDEQASV